MPTLIKDACAFRASTCNAVGAGARHDCGDHPVAKEHGADPGLLLIDREELPVNQSELTDLPDNLWGSHRLPPVTS